MNSLSNQTAHRTAQSITGLRDLAHDLVNPGQFVRNDYAELAELIDRAPHYPADIPAEAVAAARQRLTDAASRGNVTAARLLRELETAR